MQSNRLGTEAHQENAIDLPLKRLGTLYTEGILDGVSDDIHTVLT